MSDKFQEPIAPRYIYINPITNHVHLMMPIAEGAEQIGTNNTCKSVQSLQVFFAKKPDKYQKSAFEELITYQAALVQRWAEVFNHAYTDFNQRILQHNTIPIDHYAATSPAEFFAVFSELFFEKPEIIREYYPNVYEQLVKFYCQDPE